MLYNSKFMVAPSIVIPPQGGMTMDGSLQKNHFYSMWWRLLIVLSC